MFRNSVALCLGLAIGAFGCVSAASRARLDGFERRAARDDEATDVLSTRVAAFERGVDDLVGLHQRASDELEHAAARLDQARRLAGAAGRDYDEAARNYETAAEHWRLVTVAIVAAATWDYAGHLCDTRMTTAQFRRQLRREGFDPAGLDADHGLPRSLGGADHPLNYEMINSSLNRSLGNRVLEKLVAQPTHVLRGALITALMRLRCSPQL